MSRTGPGRRCRCTRNPCLWVGTKSAGRRARKGQAEPRLGPGGRRQRAPARVGTAGATRRISRPLWLGSPSGLTDGGAAGPATAAPPEPLAAGSQRRGAVPTGALRHVQRLVGPAEQCLGHVIGAQPRADPDAGRDPIRARDVMQRVAPAGGRDQRRFLVCPVEQQRDSSPPRRPTTSVSRAACRMTPARSRRARSPQWWPLASLSALRLSRSATTTLKVSPRFCATIDSRTRRSWKAPGSGTR